MKKRTFMKSFQVQKRNVNWHLTFFYPDVHLIALITCLKYFHATEVITINSTMLNTINKSKFIKIWSPKVIAGPSEDLMRPLRRNTSLWSAVIFTLLCHVCWAAELATDGGSSNHLSHFSVLHSSLSHLLAPLRFSVWKSAEQSFYGIV